MYFKKAAVLGLAVAGAAYAEAAQIQKRDGGHGHSHAAAPAPASGYGAPAASYGAPAPDTGYGAPDTGYGAPDTGYGAPATSYDEPESYDAAPTYGADGEVGPGILPFVAVILAIIGLSLLFPAVVNIQSGRKRRSVAEESNPVYDLAERVQEMYGAVVRSEECMEKIVCELGGMAKDLTASPVTGLVEPFVPKKYSNYYKQFRSGKDCHKIKC
jgi:hypothetical protein